MPDYSCSHTHVAFAAEPVASPAESGAASSQKQNGMLLAVKNNNDIVRMDLPNLVVLGTAIEMRVFSCCCGAYCAVCSVAALGPL